VVGQCLGVDSRLWSWCPPHGWDLGLTRCFAAASVLVISLVASAAGEEENATGDGRDGDYTDDDTDGYWNGVAA